MRTLSSPRVGRVFLGFAAALAVGAGPMATTAHAQAAWWLVNLHPSESPAESNSNVFAVTPTRQFGLTQVGFEVAVANAWSGRQDLRTPIAPPNGWESLFVAAAAPQVGDAVTRLAVQLGNYNASPQVLHAAVTDLAGAVIVDLHPPTGWLFSFMAGMSPDGVQQVGSVTNGPGMNQAAVWNGSAATFTVLNPAGATFSVANSCEAGVQVGSARINGAIQAGLWRGSAASWMNLHPAGAASSEARAIAGGRQGGKAVINGVDHAGLWSGTAASWVDLHPTRPAPLPPPNVVSSAINSMSGDFQAGTIVTGEGFTHAALWKGSSTVWVDLHSFLPPEAIESRANAVVQDGPMVSIGGSVFNGTTNRTEAFLWVTRCTGCAADFNCSGSFFPPFTGAVTVQDLFDFLNAWFAGSSQADFNRTFTVTVQDLFDYLDAYFAGCE